MAASSARIKGDSTRGRNNRVTSANGPMLSQADVARKLGITRQAVHLIEARAIRKLRAALVSPQTARRTK